MNLDKFTKDLSELTSEQQRAVLDKVTATVKQNKQVREQSIAQNVDLVMQALKKIEANMLNRVQDSANLVESRVKTIKDGKDGKDGLQGPKGEKGDRGFDGVNGKDGRDGKDGKDGIDGKDGVGVTDAHIDFDGSLVIKLTNGNEINVGEVLPMDLSEKIRVISNGGGTSQYVLDALASLQAQIDAGAALPSQTGNAGKFLTTNGSTTSWAAVSGTGTVTSVSVTAPTGLTVTGSPITTSGTIALSYTTGYSLPTTSSQTNWDSAYTNSFKWNGGSSGLVAATGRTSLGATTVGSNLFTLTDPSAVTFPRFNADNTVSALSASAFRTAIGAGTSSTSGTVTSVDISVPTGLAVSGNPITSSGTLAVTFSAGYSIPTTAKQTNWDTAYGWGNHASAGYATTGKAIAMAIVFGG